MSLIPWWRLLTKQSNGSSSFSNIYVSLMLLLGNAPRDEVLFRVPLSILRNIFPLNVIQCRFPVCAYKGRHSRRKGPEHPFAFSLWISTYAHVFMWTYSPACLLLDKEIMLLLLLLLFRWRMHSSVLFDVDCPPTKTETELFLDRFRRRLLTPDQFQGSRAICTSGHASKCHSKEFPFCCGQCKCSPINFCFSVSRIRAICVSVITRVIKRERQRPFRRSILMRWNLCLSSIRIYSF